MVGAMRTAIAIAVAAAGCKPIPPPPILPAHVSTAPGPRGESTVMLVLGFAGEPLGGGGYGLAVRAEHQETDRTTLGLELGAGYGDRGTIGHAKARHYLVAVRGYGRFSPDLDWVDLTYSAGLSVMRTGLVTATVHAGAGIGYPNRYVVPTLHGGLALAVPLAHGEIYGDGMDVPSLTMEHAVASSPNPNLTTPTTKLYWYLDPGVVVPIETWTASVDVGIASPLVGSDDGVISGSVAGGVRR